MYSLEELRALVEKIKISNIEGRKQHEAFMKEYAAKTAGLSKEEIRKRIIKGVERWKKSNQASSN